MKPETMDLVFRALASPRRRQVLDVLKARPGSSVNDVCDHFDMSRIAVMKHIRILEEAQLVHSHKEGRVRRLHFNAVPIQMIYDRWTTEYSSLWASGMTRLKYRIESGATPKTKVKKK